MNTDYSKFKISIILPVFNEAESLFILNQEIEKVLNDNSLINYEIIYIDDGSTDDSFVTMKSILKNNSRIKIISLRKNLGKSAVLSLGFYFSTGDLVLTMDADLQDDPHEIPLLIDFLNQNDLDLVSGWKKKRQDILVKKFSSKIFNFTLKKVSKVNIHDFNCGLKIYRQEVAKNINLYGEMHRFIPMLAHEQGFKVGEKVVNHRERKFGKSKYGKSGFKRLKNYFIDPFTVLLITRYLNKPAHFFGTFGLALILFGFLLCSYLTVLWFFGEQISNRPLLFLGILLIIVGIQVLSLGFLGELIGHKDKKNNLNYIKDASNFDKSSKI